MLKTVCIFLVCFAVAAAQLMTVTTKAAESCPDENKAAPGMKLSMHYTGKIAESSATGTKGKVFDSSIPRGQPFEFVLGRGQVIAGWDQGLDGICVGEKRELTIPPDMGYGDRGAGADIPGGATLHFEVECLAVGPPGLEPPQPNIFEEIDRDHSHTLTLEVYQTHLFASVSRRKHHLLLTPACFVAVTLCRRSHSGSPPSGKWTPCRRACGRRRTRTATASSRGRSSRGQRAAATRPRGSCERLT